jgi:hypothetical protein
MEHKIHVVADFAVVGPYTLRVVFEDHTSQTIDFRPVLEGELYGPLRNLVLFEQVRLDADAHTLVWPNGADFDPATLHDWSQYADAFAAQAAQWGTAAVAKVAEPRPAYHVTKPH